MECVPAGGRPWSERCLVCTALRPLPSLQCYGPLAPLAEMHVTIKEHARDPACGASALLGIVWMVTWELVAAHAGGAVTEHIGALCADGFCGERCESPHTARACQRDHQDSGASTELADVRALGLRTVSAIVGSAL